ncbi:hypothetical protein A3B18_03790 [Candidatus Giovannonibacteria bacterium RIFCSPLOWO2_01_FULL_46_13]|uniref:HicB-like antitoxin of toxin-antitoxin system domain-containing protein n=1 Tax=Candidatus Giovannonibacteria bacterium RIFCSPLOWO2_01_FULL_46_13 TaxID=1798352 RepID=A0A1F5X3H4_9BACT|nr:MAG: hypothetical protein A3B18_03790 [Candidatus Giovannonibacteria bacterium RIFCSPLOWO2_01_FULL_46_13]
MVKKTHKIKRTKFDGQLRFPIILRKEPEGGFTVLVPALPGCITFGRDIDEAQKMAKEAIELYLEDMIERGEPIPNESPTYTGEVTIDLPRKTASFTHA